MAAADGGYIHVSASTAGDFGGKEYGVLIDSADENQEAAISFTNVTAYDIFGNPSTGNQFTMGIDGDGSFKIADSHVVSSNTRFTIDSSGNIAVAGTVDGRDLATDGSKLDGIEASADVTDATNVQSAGALMDRDWETIVNLVFELTT